MALTYLYTSSDDNKADSVKSLIPQGKENTCRPAGYPPAMGLASFEPVDIVNYNQGVHREQVTSPLNSHGFG